MAKTQNANLQETLCKILDAVFMEDLGTDEKPGYSNSIYIKLQEVKTNTVFTSQLTNEEVQALTGLSRAMDSREMIKFAKELRDREEPVKMLVPSDTRQINPKTIKASEELDNDQSYDLSNSVVEKTIPKFAYKKKKGN